MNISRQFLYVSGLTSILRQATASVRSGLRITTAAGPCGLSAGQGIRRNSTLPSLTSQSPPSLKHTHTHTHTHRDIDTDAYTQFPPSLKNTQCHYAASYTQSPASLKNTHRHKKVSYTQPQMEVPGSQHIKFHVRHITSKLGMNMKLYQHQSSTHHHV